MDMRLYRMELYKLLYKKIFRFGLLAVLGILLAYFLLVSVGGERTTINGELYTGFAAVREDRRITEKFRGVLTDEKARQIIEQYGFPSKVEENYGGFRDENYLNGFVTEQLGNGYYFSWDDYQISTALQPLAESGLGAAARAAGREVLLDYAEGWGVFLDLLQLGMILGSALIVTIVSPVFSEEHQTKMSTLLFSYSVRRRRLSFGLRDAHVPGYDRRIDRMVQRLLPPCRHSSLYPRGQQPSPAGTPGEKQKQMCKTMERAV